MNKFKCRHCSNRTNMILYLEGERGICLKCLGDKYKNKKASELNV